MGSDNPTGSDSARAGAAAHRQYVLCARRRNGTHLTHFSLVDGVLLRDETSSNELPSDPELVVDLPETCAAREPVLALCRKPEEPGAIDWYADVLSPLLEFAGWPHECVRTTSDRSIAETAARLSSSSSGSSGSSSTSSSVAGRQIAIFGGDTSVHEFVNALPLAAANSGSELRIAVIPTGSGNALATSSGVVSPLHAIRALLRQQWAPLSTFTVQFNDGGAPPVHAVVVASWGFHASLVADAENLRAQFASNPSARFRAAAQRLMEETKQEYRGVVTAGSGVRLEGPHAYVLFTSVQQLEPGFVISPCSAAPSDLRLHLVAIERLADDRDLGRVMQAAYNGGSHISDPCVKYCAIDQGSGSTGGGASDGDGDGDGDGAVSAAATVCVEEGQSSDMRRWCIDGRIFVAEPGTVRVAVPSLVCRGWHLHTLAFARP